MLTVPSRARVLSICYRPTGATNQRKLERHYLIQRNFSAVSLKNSIQVSNKVLVTFSCVRVTENKNLYKGTVAQLQRKNFHSNRVSRYKFPDNSAQWKGLQVCLCHLFKYAVFRAKYVSQAGPICRFAEIS